MNAQNLFDAVSVFQKIKHWQYVVSRERFIRVAVAKHSISERDADVLFGLFSKAIDLVGYINTDYDRQHSNYAEKFPLAMQIAEEAYEIYYHNKSVPAIPTDIYRERDDRRYFMLDTSVKPAKRLTLDVNLKEAAQIVTLAEMLKREGIEIRDVSYSKDTLERHKDGKVEKTVCYEGDIVFVFCDPTDSMWYSYYKSEKGAGVYVLTSKGWAKLLYTPGRGYVNGKRELDFDGEVRYSNHAIQGICDAQDWRYVGNIHDDISVLIDKEDDQDCNE